MCERLSAACYAPIIPPLLSSGFHNPPGNLWMLQLKNAIPRRNVCPPLYCLVSGDRTGHSFCLRRDCLIGLWVFSGLPGALARRSRPPRASLLLLPYSAPEPLLEKIVRFLSVTQIEERR